MKARISVLIGVMVALASCHSDPTASGSGTPSAVIANFSSLSLNGIGATGSFIAEIVDDRLTPLTGAISFSSCDPTTATVAADPTYVPVPNTSAKAIVTSTGLNKSCIIASASGLKPDTVSVIVAPTVFPVVLSAANPQPGNVITIKSGAPTLQFDTATVSVTFGTEKESALILSKAADSLVVAVPAFTADSMRFTGIVVTYSGSTLALATVPVTAGTNAYAGSDAYVPGFDLTPQLPASGSSVVLYPAQPLANNAPACPEVYLGFGSSGPCLIFKFTLAAPATLDFTADWPGANASNPDIDIYSCSGATASTACDFEDGGAGATGLKPQSTGNHTYPAGTHYFIIEYYAACDGSACPGNGNVSNYTLTISRQ
ncbi:MAG TPA: hypothetical protein VMC86_07515 [Gemmatimonadales bacterium]|nr:hypothetical protein [Gemmatimonadales bacterium]